MTSKNNNALLLYYVKLCASFQIHWWIQTGVTVGKRSIRVEIVHILSRMTVKFDEWPWKTIGHLFYSISIPYSTLCIISKPWVNSNWSYSPETLNSGQNQQFFVPCDLEIWQMTLKNNRAPLLSNIKLCASFHHYMWIQTGVAVRKPLNGVMTSVTLTFCMDITFVNGNNSWKSYDDTMMGTWWKRCDRRTDGQTDGRTDGLKCS